MRNYLGPDHTSDCSISIRTSSLGFGDWQHGELYGGLASHTVASPFLVQRNSRVDGGAFPLPTIRLETFGLVLPEVEITTTELAKNRGKT
jgi:hypothetical protein